MSSMIPLGEESVIHQSWERCYSFGFQPTDLLHDDLLPEQQFRQVLQENQELLYQAIPILEKLTPFLQKSGQIALLVDRSGFVLHTICDPSFEQEAQANHLRIRANWQEQKKGTNAMGIVLREEKPIRIHGDQHFFVQNRGLTCTASPIYTPTGELAGVINISALMEAYTPTISSLVHLIAESIENQLQFEQSRQEHLITIRELEYTTNQISSPLVTLDQDNRIIRANQAARRLLGKDCIGKEFHQKKGLVVETIAGHTKKIWRSVATLNKDLKHQKMYTFDQIQGNCPSMQGVKEVAQRAAKKELSVLILGETGTGKEMFAQSIHMASSRASHPFIAVNCSAIPESIIESELFGYVGGAFTGAKGDGNIGKFEAAHLGTIFLDEIGDMSLRAQAALLRVLQEKMITPVGSVKSKQVDVRIIAATNRNLWEEIKANRFRSDLYYRLKGIQLTLPPLRKRTDVVGLAEYFTRSMSDTNNYLSTEAKEKLRSYTWPGNVRELQSVLLQAVFLAEGEQIGPEHLQFEGEEGSDVKAKGGIPSLSGLEKEAIEQILQLTRWNVSQAAKLLQISRNTLYRKMAEYDLLRK